LHDRPHQASHPFEQIPTYEEGELALFESGAIVFHVAERYESCCGTMQLPGRATTGSGNGSATFPAAVTMPTGLKEMNREVRTVRDDLEQFLAENAWAAVHIWDRTQRGVFPAGTFEQTGGAFFADCSGRLEAEPGGMTPRMLASSRVLSRLSIRCSPRTRYAPREA
jgi:Glutathione S-transferase, N-terminal domain